MTLIQRNSFRQLYAFGKKLPVDLSLSENPLGCSKKIFKLFTSMKQKDFFDYPDADSTRLKEEIAKRFNVSADSIFVANGSEAIIKLLPQILLGRNDVAIIPEVTFPMFEVATRINGNRIVFSGMTKDFEINLDDIKDKITDNTRLVFLCNPNNPTGKILAKKQILKLVFSTKTNIVVDEANIEFGGRSVIGETRQFDNLIVLRTFSKGFGLAGLRIGFCVANPTIIEKLKQVSQPFPVSGVAQKAAITALKDTKFITRTQRFMAKERVFLTKELLKRGFTVIKSDANNLLVRVNRLFDSSKDFIRELNLRNVSVVDGNSFGGLGDNFIRISPRLRTINEKFIKVIDRMIEERDKATRKY